MDLIAQVERLAGAEMLALRRRIHREPELAYEEHRTSALVAEVLEDIGLVVTTGIAGTGLVATLSRGEGPTIGLRADMDALPIHEHVEGREHASCTPGVMHACGHDGHTAMLLGAARVLAADPDIRGTVHFIFQPAEECGGGARAMIEDGLLDRFPCQSVYAMHNWPGLEKGHIAVQPGPMMGSLDTFRIAVTGKGAHAAMPHLAKDPVVAGAQLVLALQTIASRTTDPADSLVLTVTQCHAGEADNVIPESLELRGTIRCYSGEVRRATHARVREICAGLEAMTGCSASFELNAGYPATINAEAEAGIAADAAQALLGAEKVARSFRPSMASEDFSFLLEACPGAYAWLGIGEDAAPLHNPAYDFADDVLTTGAAFWVTLVRRELGA
ncbi:M20 aminoacylase family protein [Novosphingobium profundi]|uniref:M20 aminoacylase family protein n=1 Tax=Novosphingobium profundi TaxID=1774954 RepID=UPI001CFF4823|nr:M20 aminoacylase family protein [Novosphingobium profundi]